VPKIAEVREIESEKEIELEVPKVEKVKAPTTSSSNEMSEEDKKIEEGAKGVLGTTMAVTTKVAPPVGLAEEGISAAGGAITEGIGKMTGNKDAEVTGRVYKEAPVKPVEEVGKGVKKGVDKIKEIFD